MRAAVIALAALLATAALAAPAAPPPEARAAKESGDRKRQAGDLEGAVAAYRTALSRAGDYAAAHEALGEVRWTQKRAAEAIASFRAAVDSDPDFALAWYNLAYAARKTGDTVTARPAYQRFVRLRPADPDGHYGFAETLRALGEREGAIREYRLFVDLTRAEPGQAAWVRKARAAIAELDEARGKVAAAPVEAATPAPAPATRPAKPAAVVPQGQAASPGPTEAPTPAPTEAPTPSPAPTPTLPPVQASPNTADSEAAPLERGAPGAEPKGAPTATQAPAASPTSPAAPIPSRALIEKLGAADRAFLSGDLKAALFLYQDAVYADPASVTARVRLARCYVALHHQPQAVSQLRQALELDPTSAEAQKALEELRNPLPGAAPVASGQPAQPAAPGDQGAHRAPTAAEVQESAILYRAGIAKIGQREFALAIDTLTRALEKNPRLSVAYEARGSARFGLALYREAAQDYATAIQLPPERASPLWGLAECQRLLGDPLAAETYERYATSAAPDATDSLRGQALKRARELRSP